MVPNITPKISPKITNELGKKNKRIFLLWNTVECRLRPLNTIK